MTDIVPDKKEREPLSSLILYHALKWSVVMPIFRGYFHGSVQGIENVPKRGAFLAVSNHASNFDPPILSAAVGRPVAFMAKEELFQVPVLKQVIRTYGAYPVKRGAGDRRAIRAALDALKAGWAVGVFLQGTRTPDGRVTSPKQGAAMIAAKAQVPLLPICISGSELIFQSGSNLPRPTTLTVRIGTAIAPPTAIKKEALSLITQECADQINALQQTEAK
ncbi:MAG: 1-acyl-sn-glycerol-3-phosphate acyltransferase [Limnothrix sp. RL_2_0]|nr:1-acyl-sn-glycerol-3-phosphate acyltransferase [Limnothrix sp. RL_2_0]